MTCFRSYASMCPIPLAGYRLHRFDIARGGVQHWSAMEVGLALSNMRGHARGWSRSDGFVACACRLRRLASSVVSVLVLLLHDWFVQICFRCGILLGPGVSHGGNLSEIA
jgi:hypothetical protein